MYFGSLFPKTVCFEWNVESKGSLSIHTDSNHVRRHEKSREKLKEWHIVEPADLDDSPLTSPKGQQGEAGVDQTQSASMPPVATKKDPEGPASLRPESVFAAGTPLSATMRGQTPSVVSMMPDQTTSVPSMPDQAPSSGASMTSLASPDQAPSSAASMSDKTPSVATMPDQAPSSAAFVSDKTPSVASMPDQASSSVASVSGKTPSVASMPELTQSSEKVADMKKSSDEMKKAPTIYHNTVNCLNWNGLESICKYPSDCPYAKSLRVASKKRKGAESPPRFHFEIEMADV